MPDSDGYLTEKEVLLDGEVWEVRECDDEDWLCEEVVDDEGLECPEKAVVELRFYEVDYHATRALCQQHFEELAKK